MKQALLVQATEMMPRLRDLYRRLHACPEVGFDLPQTRALVSEELTRLGISHKTVGKGSIVADLGEGKNRTLLRADMDALPITEETTLPHASKNGRMHACGHDLHTTALLGAAALLKERISSQFAGVRLLFQPAEETLEGALDAVESGVCEGVECAYMLHASVSDGLPVGTVILPPAGVIAPSADFFEITVLGKGCHGADPASGIDPLSAAAQIFISLQHLPAREFPSGERAALTVGTLQGGDAFNVIPHRALLRGSMRCYDEPFRVYLKQRVKEISQGIARALRADASVEFPTGCPSLVNDKELRAAAVDPLTETLGERFYQVTERTGTAGSEDFAVISRTVPSLMLALSAGPSPSPLHHPGVVFDEGCLPYASAALAALALSHN